MRLKTDILTVREKILIAAYELGPLPFDVERLVVRCWERWPETFAMREYPQFADSNRVLAQLSGRESLSARGHLRDVAPSRFEITLEGIALARQLLPLARRAA